MSSITLQDVKDAAEHLKESPLVIRTPALPMKHVLANANILESGTEDLVKALSSLTFKLESMQNYGSFKIRGVANQFRDLPSSVRSGNQKLMTFSAGNYGKAFAAACHKLKLPGHVVMPDTAPHNRVVTIEGYGLTVGQKPVKDVVNEVERLVKEEGMVLMHPFDDIKLVHGYGSVALEMFEDVPDADLVITGCGGGGLLAAVSFTCKQLKPECQIYGVEPETANVMYRSFEQGEPASLYTSHSIASGLSPPYAGKSAYQICRQNVEEIVLVSEDEIKSATLLLYSRGLVVEPAGAAAVAALLCGKIPNTAMRNVVVIISGSNMSPEEVVAIKTSLK